LAHEFKHILDHPFIGALYPVQSADTKQAEEICDYFAACLLMPRTRVKSLWSGGLQDVEGLAARFRVSPAAMSRRLQDLGLLDRPVRHLGLKPIHDVTRYFRREAGSLLAYSAEQCPFAA
jgi:Zn-dependent peptidase ImmA (M78 family)